MREIKTRGIDVSEWQGEIDWEKVKASGIGFAILRCGYGRDLAHQDDTYFARNASECERLGIPYGVYLFSYATTVEAAKSEAAHVLRLLKGRKPRYPVFYDLEDAETTGSQSNARILAMAKAFAEEIEAAGYTVGIYANYYWNTTKLTDPWYDTKSRWIALYDGTNGYEGPCDIWQYSSTGTVPGAPGGCDMNYGYVDYDAPEQPVTAEDEAFALPTLRNGSEGGTVKAMQILLIGNQCSCGSHGADGIFGTATENAVMMYQDRHDLAVDGICGPKTWASLLGR